jgi:Rrf2 family nitric oxide-sensitive transcriptional repressor
VNPDFAGAAMRLTKHTDFGLRCLTFLAVHDDAPATVRTIAARIGTPEDHLFKVVGKLAVCGYVQTIRGRAGGVRLARPASHIIVGQVVRDLEESLALVACFDPEDEPCPIAPACVLAGTIDEALSAFFRVLDGVTLEMLAKPRRRLATLMRV